MWVKVKCPKCEEETENVDSSFKYNYSQRGDNIAACPVCNLGFGISICDSCEEIKEVATHTKGGDILCVDCKKQYEAEPGLAIKLERDSK